MFMIKKSLSWIPAIVFGCAVTLFTACNDDSNEPVGEGEVEFEITDAPIDDANVKSVVVTVNDVKVNGTSLSGFTRQTVDLKALYDGNTKILGSATMGARAYSNVTLVLDLNTDAQGNSPGCYVLSQDNIKYKLKSTASGTTDIAVSQSWRAVKDTKTKIVLDFDLRKSIRYADDAAVRYSFVSDNNLQAAVRLVARAQSGTIKGSYEQTAETNAEKVFVYAYKKGTFNAAAETTAQGSDGIYFKNAVASAEVKQGLTGKIYTLAFLPEGEYELHFAGYSNNTSTGRVSFNSMLKSETRVNGTVASFIRIEAAASVSLSSSIQGAI
jgi:hypothetical protein